MFEVRSEMESHPSLVIGVDVGGTFTDVFVLDEALGKIQVLKVPSTTGRTSGDQSQGFLAGIREALKAPDPRAQLATPHTSTDASASGLSYAAIATIVHGTTAGTNALLERKIARTGLITTRGFRDVLEMRRRDRPSTWGLWGQFEPLIERRLRAEVDERVLADGTVLEAVNLEQVISEVRRLKDLGCEALVIAFINAYANPINEQQALAAALEAWRDLRPNKPGSGGPNQGEPNQGEPNLSEANAPVNVGYVSASYQILPEIREFERTSTAALNAALQPVVGKYVQRLDDGLKQAGFLGQLLIVQSNGGVMDVATTCLAPVKTALSGPAAGVMACAFLARESGYPDVITGDMGGTSFDVSLIAKGQPSLASQTSIEFGMVIRSPMIEITTIGAGGGSVASVDSSGLLQVGPESAGSYPGPVCYGLRGQDVPASVILGPCVTDANVVLGRINALKPIGKLPALDVEAARHAIGLHIGDPLGLNVEAAAEAILAVANAKMAGAIRLVSIERGHDPKQFAYMPFGGGGALHVCAMMKEVGVTQGIVPRYPGVTSALGCVIADMRRDYVRTLNQSLALVSQESLRESIRDFVAQGRQALRDSRVKFSGEQITVELDMLYQGQSHTISVPLDAADAMSAGFGVAMIETAFVRAYRSSFGQTLEAVPMRLMNLRVAVIGIRPKFDLSLMAPTPVAALAASRPVPSTRPVFHAGDWHETPIFARMDLPVGFEVSGPALFEQADTTVWLEPGFQALVDRVGNLLIQARGAVV
jgi:N-methylhydantoinase A